MKAKLSGLFKLIRITAAFGIATGILGCVTLDTKASHDRVGVRSIVAKASAFFLDTGRVPESVNDLLNNARQLEGWKGPYLTEAQSRNSWGHRYVIRAPGLDGSDLDVVSLGVDGREGGSGRNADIGNWESK